MKQRFARVLYFLLIKVIFIKEVFSENVELPSNFLIVHPPEDVSTTGHLVDRLFNLTTGLVVFYFALVCLGLFLFSFLYRKRRHPKAEYTFGNRRAQILATTVIGVLVFLTIDLNITLRSNEDLVNTFWNFPDVKKEKVLRLQVLGQQWMWHFRYPGKDDVFNTDDDIVTAHELKIPVGRKIYLQFTSKDVIHSFYLPNFRTKIDVMPGRKSRLWIEAKKTGEFDIACAEMCGTHHYLMKGKLSIYSEKEFEEWQNEASVLASATNDPSNVDSYWGWKWENER